MGDVIHLFTRDRIVRPPAPTLDTFERYQQRIKQRFGPKLPKFLTKAWRRQWDEPYRFGCVHNIQYRDPAVCKGPWNRPMPFGMRMDPDVDEIGKDVRRGGTDPLMWMDRKHGITRDFIRRRSGKALLIHTRSDLIAHDDYLSALDRENHEVIIYITGATDPEVRVAEPGAPSNKRRLKAVEKLQAHGISVRAVYVEIPR